MTNDELDVELKRCFTQEEIDTFRREEYARMDQKRVLQRKAELSDWQKGMLFRARLKSTAVFAGLMLGRKPTERKYAVFFPGEVENFVCDILRASDEDRGMSLTDMQQYLLERFRFANFIILAPSEVKILGDSLDGHKLFIVENEMIIF